MIPNSSIYKLWDPRKVISKPQSLHLKKWELGDKENRVERLEPPKLKLIFFRMVPEPFLDSGNDSESFLGG